jgi:hypothetical protein
MKAIGYLFAGAALLTGLADAALAPAPASSLQSGWQYLGCYRYEYPNAPYI